MKNILLPVDGSESSKHAVDYTIDMISRLPNEHRPVLHLLNVQRALSQNFNMVVREEDRAKHYEEDGRKVIDPIESLLKLKNVTYTPHIIISGEPSTGIADFAKERNCDLIIMGSRGLGNLKSVVMGSVAMKVVHEANVPVLLVK
ncbi:MAG: universal stress protein [Methylophilaceae bacterium]